MKSTISYLPPGASGGVMVSKLDEHSFTGEFESHWVSHSYGLVPYLSTKLIKLLQVIYHLFLSLTQGRSYEASSENRTHFSTF